MGSSPQRHEHVFTEAVQLAAAARSAYLDQACADDPALRQRVESLLKAHDKAGDFLTKSPPDLQALGAAAIIPGEKPGDWIGRYKLLQQIGEGGCGVVFLADQEQPLRRQVALKILKPGIDTKNVIARFEAERQALALMEHPNIAKVLDAGATATGRPYFVMELVRGIKITDYCDQHSLTMHQRLNLFSQVCRAIQHAHQKGIIHRDIKPTNILVTTDPEGKPLPVIIDFGIAKATANQCLTDKTLFTSMQMFIGTPAYMSPEQAMLTNVDVDTRSDIYSLGILLYELLTGSTPFDTCKLLAAGLDEIRRVIREQDPLRPSLHLSKMSKADLTIIAQRQRSEPPLLLRAIRGDLDWIVIKALEKDRARRYDTANSLALDIERFLANEPVSARAPSTWYKFHKTLQRNKMLFICIGVIVILLIVSLILVSASLAKERQSRLEARQVKQFLEEMLKGVEPEVALGRDTTILREILDKAAARIDTETNQPAVAAELRSVIGAVYEQTDQYRQAEEMQRKALAICWDRFGPESPEAAAALNELGVTLLASGHWLEAEQVNREALEIRRRRFGNENADVATSEDNLAHACNNNGKLTEAEALICEALATRRKLFGEKSPEVMDSLRNQVIILGDTGKWAEAEATAREVLGLRRKLLGLQDPSVAGALTDLAWTAIGNGDKNEAEASEREALALRQKVLSDNNPEVAQSLYDVGDRMRQHGSLEDACTVLSMALSLFRKSVGDDHPYTLYTMRDLAGALEGQGKWGEAETLHRKTLASWRKLSGNENAQTLWECNGLYHDLVSQRKYDEAEQVLDETLTPAFAKKPASADLQFARVDLMGRQARWTEAEADLNLYIQADPANHYGYHALAAVLAITQNQPTYHQLCRKILPMFVNTSNPYVAERVADDCLLLPECGVDLQLVDKLATRAVNIQGDEPYFQVCKALSAYRQGYYPEAVKWAEKSLNTSQVFAHAKGCAVLAMAQWQLGQKEKARATLFMGDSLAPRISSAQINVDLGDSWLAWLFARIMLDEAGRLTQPASPTERNSNNP